MGQLKMYQPTKGMAAADRTKAGYAAVIKELSSNGRRELKWENSTDISPHWA